MRVGALKLKLQLVCGDAFAMGPGKADLLAAIARAGSISAAARALGMSYRRAWLLVDEMNRCFRERLVAAHPGGGRERGAQLTDNGRAVLAAYRALEERSTVITESDAYRALTGMVRETPLAATAEIDPKR
ncbi:LysR family transcriptional regulator [Sphingomonas sp. SUN019]|uniref:winged helix-turn-helix domain-containing protein n=1 Tax=Sphingomonas sp. SUN019 TaxID=2937788 RepID=UPI002164920D|nr:LysR family transcriptional regulator [Sphingomonas sp. SUN019]UVO51434.1 LysR family transcriptional regulator [Sphingomonas sp. SUN019]